MYISQFQKLALMSGFVVQGHISLQIETTSGSSIGTPTQYL